MTDAPNVTPQQAPAGVLLCDDVDTAELVRRWLGDTLAMDTVASDLAGARVALAEAGATVLVFACSRIELAERILLGLWHHGPMVLGTALCQRLLLCGINEAPAAYDLCAHGVFSDYAVIRPLHDPLRVPWAVQQAVARIGGGVAGAEMGRLREAAEGVQATLATMREAVATGREQVTNEAAESLEQLGAALAQDLAAAEHVNREVGRTRDAIIESVGAWSSELDQRCADQAVSTEALAAALPPVRTTVLLVEDSAFDATVVRAVLEPAGYRVHTVGSGMAALAQVGELRPALVLLDIALPDGPGLMLIPRLRAAGCDAPVVMVTGRGDRETVRQAMAAGAREFVVKPPRRDTLLAKVAALAPLEEAQSSAPAPDGDPLAAG